MNDEQPVNNLEIYFDIPVFTSFYVQLTFPLLFVLRRMFELYFQKHILIRYFNFCISFNIFLGLYLTIAIYFYQIKNLNYSNLI